MNWIGWPCPASYAAGKDIDDLKFLINKIDGSDASKEKVNRIRSVAKVEVPQALTALGSICAAADAIMVARGDLGVEMDLEQVPVLQKRIMAAAHAHGKSVIVATQMLESMITAAKPNPRRSVRCRPHGQRARWRRRRHALGRNLGRPVPG